MSIVAQQMKQVRELAGRRVAVIPPEYYGLVDKYVADYEKTLRLTLVYESAIKHSDDMSSDEKAEAIADNLRNYDRLNIIYNKLEHVGTRARGETEKTFDGVMALLEYEVDIYESMKRANMQRRRAGQDALFSASMISASRKRIARCEKKLAKMGG